MANQKGFDLITHPRNSKGQVTRTNHYRLVIENGEKRFERPPGSGKWYFENNELCNPDAQVKSSQEVDQSAADLIQELFAAKAELAALKATQASEVKESVDQPKQEIKLEAASKKVEPSKAFSKEK